MHIILGEPTEVQRYEGYNKIRESHLWFYSGNPTQGLPAHFFLLFFKRYDVGVFELYNLRRTGQTPSCGDQNWTRSRR